jgi:hypothetical protein
MASPFVSARAVRLIRSFSIAATWAALALTASAAETFKVRLRPVPIEASTAAATTGAGAATAELDGRRLKLTGDFSGLKGAATVARLHQGAVMGVRGPAIADVRVPAMPSGQFSAEVTLTAAQAEGVRQGHVYLQIHSASAPEGNLWGWLVP